MIFKIIQKIKFWWIIAKMNPTISSVGDISELDYFTVEQIEKIKELQFDNFFYNLNQKFSNILKNEKITPTSLLTIFNNMKNVNLLKRTSHDQKWQTFSFENLHIKISNTSNVWYKIYYNNVEIFSYYPFQHYYIPGNHWEDLIILLGMYVIYLEDLQKEQSKNQRNELINQIIKQDNPFEE